MFLFDLESSEEIKIEENSIWIEDHICFINTTETLKFDFPSLNDSGTKQCSVLSFDRTEGEFNTHHLQVETQECSESSCTFKIDSNLPKNEVILDGSSVVCDRQPYFGIITKNVQQEIEFMVISETNFEKLERLEKTESVTTEQVYEEVDGFASLSSSLQTRTTAFSCGGDNEDYDENLLMSRSLPWVVRVFFQNENSTKGAICSGKEKLFLCFLWVRVRRARQT